ncbi:MAG TPA: hypothetical protein VK324_03875 [Tepidisphaeraceae bacterium]|nr:hypothetical protein [Tepidisphaeraceae bacterium]
MPAPLANIPAVQHAAYLVRRDPKKATVLAVLVAVLGGMWGRMLLTDGGGGPATAVAAAVGPAMANVTNLTTSPSEDRGRAPRPSGDALAQWVKAPVVPAGRNLFALKLDYFPQDPTKVDQTLRAPSGSGFWDKLAKSMASRADQRKERQILVENLQLQAAQLRLQSTVMGTSPRALINGDMMGEGDVVASFRVVRIEARRIIVEREGVRLEIPMK